VVFSEYALANPSAWDYIRPILAENGGFAAFIYTPRGPNHGQTLFEAAKQDPTWFAERLTVDDTQAITPEVLRQELKDLVANNGQQGEAIYQQEYYCSFTAAIVGAYYGREMQAAGDEGRIVTDLYDPGLQVHTAWDLGASDHTVIWFFQQDGFHVRWIDYYAANGFGLDHYAGVLQERAQARRYRYGRHHLPHDVEQTHLGGGHIAKSRKETLEGLGIPVTVGPRVKDVSERINVVRRILPRSWFDREKCAEGIKALWQYRRAWDDVRKVFYERPQHDWASHPADSFGEGCMGLQEPRTANQNIPKRQMSWVV
jgi:hypothetical protein